MEVLITVKAKVMADETLSSIKAVDVLGCEKASIVRVVPLSKAPVSLKTRNDYIENIFETMEKVFGYTKNQIIGSSRKRPLVYIRHVIVYHLRHHSKFVITLQDVGKILGGRDWTTCINSVKKYKELTEVKDPFFAKFDIL